jgi:S1-C subfamily serine protease
MEHTDTLVALSDGMADAVDKIAASVVKVNGRRRRSGSGVVFAQNKVLTASHVLEREEDLSVESADGRTLTARFAGRDHSTDLAVLDVEGLDVEPATAAEGDARVGQISLAVGSHSRGEGPRATLGVVSTVGGPVRTRRGPRLERYIQTDATPYPGFSGGPLIDARGSVLGILVSGWDAARRSPYPPTWPGVPRERSRSGAPSSAGTSASLASRCASPMDRVSVSPRGAGC